jgi:ArsR family transcriptional regulator
MLALARARLAGPGLGHCAVRLADMYRLPLPDGNFETVVLQMVLHHAEDPAGVVQEAARVLAPGGRLLLIDLAEHHCAGLTGKLAHRWPGFADASIARMFAAAGLQQSQPVAIAGTLPVRIWPAIRMAEAATTSTRELAL